MATSRDIRIVTNAALNEIEGRYDGIQNAYEADIERGLILYHEGAHLLNPAYRHRIESSIASIGYRARVIGVRRNPPPPLPTPRGFVQPWGDRVTAWIEVEGVRAATDVNRITDAIAFARTGDRSSVVPDPSARSILVSYDSRRLARKNIEFAIACAGFDAGTTAAGLNSPGGFPHDWLPVSLR